MFECIVFASFLFMFHIICGLMARSQAARLEGFGFKSHAVDWIARQTFFLFFSAPPGKSRGCT